MKGLAVNVKGKLAAVHHIKSYRRSKSIVSVILYLDVRWKSAVTSHPGRITSKEEKLLVHIDQEAGYAAKSWDASEKDKFLVDFEPWTVQPVA